MTVDSQLVSSIGKGVLVFAAVDRDDTVKEVESMAAKVLKMKMWPDDSVGGAVCITSENSRIGTELICQAQWKYSVQDVKGEVLCGRRPESLRR